MKHSDLTEKDDPNATPFTLADLRAQLRKQGLYVTPQDVGACWTSEKQLECALVLSPHAENGTTYRYCTHALRGAWRTTTASIRRRGLWDPIGGKR